MALSKRLRYEVLARDNHRCRYCGAAAPDVKLTVDHVVPVALGGGDDPTNLVAACSGCNAGKTSTSPSAAVVADVADDALRWAAAMQKAYDVIAAEEARLDEIVEEFDAYWLGWHYGAKDDEDNKLPRPLNWADSIRNLVGRGLSIELLVRYAESALGNDRVSVDGTWRYFCGICWRTLEKQQELARQMLDDEVV